MPGDSGRMKNSLSFDIVNPLGLKCIGCFTEKVNSDFQYTNNRDYKNQGRLSPLEWWKPPPPPDGQRRGSWHDIHALYLSQVGVSEREEMIKAPIIIEGAEHPRIEGGEVEKLNNLKFITTVLEHKPCSG